ncbi:GAF and ANTAR domain-containing protein [Kocuria turfanensis]|uniref:Transcriptional regulator n=1 Tax=Kocuria turfanensis TaxID=388357 RepID=A0A512I9T2_9MICC|nr:GAF and ANTAR domain-containing protein [Kocuria turfanensis]GEO94459.1 transcriptional regulator [Kocuria turfanensis]
MSTPLPATPADPDGLAEIADAVVRLGETLRTVTADTLVEAVIRQAVETLPGARWASITTLRHGTFRTLAATGKRALQADALQYRVGSGPCVDAALEDSVHRSGDLAHDVRWPEYGAQVAREVGMRSALAYRLTLVADPDLVAALNLYSDVPDAFDAQTEWAGTMLATHAAWAVSTALAQERAENLELALRSNREIGTAIGVLMAQHKLTRQQAHELLRLASQDTNRKMADIATEVVDTGELSLPRRPGRPAPEARGD